MNTTDTPWRNLLVMMFPPPHVRRMLDEYRRRCIPADAHFPDDVRMHMTLFALGMVHVDRQALLKEVLRDVSVEPLELALRRPPALRRTTTMPARGNACLRALRADMRTRLEGAGFGGLHGGESPHVTLAYKVPSGGVPLPMPDIPWVATEFTLVWSKLPPHFWPEEHVILDRYAAGVARQSRLFH